jgi:hypothetical protein
MNECLELSDEAIKFLVEQGTYGFKKRFPAYGSIAMTELSKFRYDYIKSHPRLANKDNIILQVKRHNYYEKRKRVYSFEPGRFKQDEMVMERFRKEYDGEKNDSLYYGEAYPFELMEVKK